MLRARETGALLDRQRSAVTCLAFTVRPAHFPACADTVAELFRRSAATVRRLTRAGDIVARVGQTEFVVLAPGADASAAAQIVERLDAHLATGTNVAFRCVMRVVDVADALSTDVGMLIDSAVSSLRGAVAPDDHTFSVVPGARRLPQLVDAGRAPSSEPSLSL